MPIAPLGEVMDEPSHKRTCEHHPTLTQLKDQCVIAGCTVFMAMCIFTVFAFSYTVWYADELVAEYGPKVDEALIYARDIEAIGSNITHYIATYAPAIDTALEHAREIETLGNNITTYLAVYYPIATNLNAQIGAITETQQEAADAATDANERLQLIQDAFGIY